MFKILKFIASKILSTSQSSFAFIFTPTSPYLKKLFWILPYTIILSLAYQISPLFLKTSLDAFQNNQTSLNFGFLGNYNFQSIFGLVVFLLLSEFALNLSLNIYGYFQALIVEKLDFQIESTLEDKLNIFLNTFDNSFLSAENNLRIITTMQWELSGIERETTEVLKKIISAPTSLIALVFVLPLINPWLLVFVVLISIFNIIIESFQSQNWRKFEILTDRQQTQKNQLKWLVMQKFGRVVLDGWFSELWKFYSEIRLKLWKSVFDRNQSDRKLGLFKDNINTLSTTGLYLFSFYLIIRGDISLGSFVVFPLYIGRVKDIFNDLGDVLQKLVSLRFKYTKLDFILNLKPKLNNKKQQEPDILELESLEIKNLDFKYPQFFDEEKSYLEKLKNKINFKTAQKVESKNIFTKIFAKINEAYLGNWERKNLEKSLKEIQEVMDQTIESKEILKNLNLKLEKGKIYALIGYNGAGKSTFINLLKRGFDPKKGEILVNYKDKQNIQKQLDLKYIKTDIWKSVINSVDQQSLVWPTLSIRQNMEIGSNLKFSDQQIWKVLEELGLDSKINSLDQIIHENIKLSGGQEQMLEIARIYLQQKPLVILDEGTNQLDAEKEAGILKILNKIKQKSIVIVISHRMTTAAKCDYIYVLDKGVIESKGNHKELIKNPNSLYKKFWDLQVPK